MIDIFTCFVPGTLHVTVINMCIPLVRVEEPKVAIRWLSNVCPWLAINPSNAEATFIQLAQGRKDFWKNF